MNVKKENSIEESLRRFLKRGEPLSLPEFREELAKEGGERVKRALFRLGQMPLEARREVMWERVEQRLSRERKRRRRVLCAKYAAIFVIPLLTAVWLLSERVEESPIDLVRNAPGTVERNRAYLVLGEGKTLGLNKSRQDTIWQKDGSALAVDTSGVLIYNGRKEMKNELAYHTLVVPRGGEYVLVLSDGSRVRLNADSELRYPVEFGDSERKVFLKGEGYFEVQHEEDRPFRVEVLENVMIEVLGTEFNINAYDESDRIYTTLVNGSVRLGSLLSDSTVVLRPRQQAIVGQDGISVKDVDPQEYITWINGRFYFERKTLEEILLQLQRWYDLKVFWTNEELKSYEFTGALWRDSSVEEIFDMMEKTTEIHFTVSGQTVTVSY